MKVQISRISLTVFLSLFFNLILAQEISIDHSDEGLLFREGRDSVLFYQRKNKDFRGKYGRSNYIHPLYSLDGQILTEDFPADHLHHRGIFWAWHQLYVGEKRIGDGWEIKDFKWEVLSVVLGESEGPEKSIRTNVIWKSPLWLDSDGKEVPLVSENTVITVYPAKEEYRQVDIEISIIALEPNMRIGGSQDAKGYGGFSQRIRLVDDIEFNSSTGKVQPQNLPIEAGGWMDFSGSLGADDSLAGIAVLSHPENPGYPNPWILRSSGSMQNAVFPHPGARTIPLSNLQPTVLKYRLLIHQGMKVKAISKHHSRYGKMITSDK